MHMNNFDNEPIQSEQEYTPRSFENQSHVILHDPIEVDLAQPDRSDGTLSAELTGFPESKLIAEIITPTNAYGIIHTQLSPEETPVIMLVGNEAGIKSFLEPGFQMDISDEDKEEKCIVSFDKTGKHLFVRAKNVDVGYQIFTRELEQLKEREDFSADDPDF
jgi:hypothetical protein